MVRLARTDGSYTDAERRAHRPGAGGALRLGPAEAARRAASRPRPPRRRRPDTVQFTRLIKDGVPYEERTGVVEALWRVAAAEGSTPTSAG